MQLVEKALVLALCFTLFSGARNIASDEESSEPSNVEEIQSIKANLKWIQKEKWKLQSKLEKGPVEEVANDLKNQLTEVLNKEKRVSLQLLESVTGVELTDRRFETKQEKRELIDEIQELLMPLIDGLRRVSERPRKIEKLRYEIDRLSTVHKNYVKAHQNVEERMRVGAFKKVSSDLKRAKREVRNASKEVGFEIQTLERTLQQELGQKKSFLDVASDIFGTFFKTKGKNLILSLFSLLIVFWLFMSLRTKVFEIPIISRKMGQFKKGLQLAYNIASVVFALMGGLLCLYILNDWVLVTFALIVITGVLWSLKQFVPQLLDEIRLVLNLGTVREGERVDWKGIPWRVSKLSFYSTLINEKLQGGRVIVAARELVKLHSRKNGPSERWFPTEPGNWIRFDGGNLGKVISQSPDHVILRKLGGAIVQMPTMNFIESPFENLSQGFRVSITVGLDYGIQKDILAQYLLTFRTKYKSKLGEVPSLKSAIKNIEIDFHSGGDSSLNLWVAVDCEGDVAPMRDWIERKLNSFFVEICNEEKLDIPFPQVTLSARKELNQAIKS